MYLGILTLYIKTFMYPGIKHFNIFHKYYIYWNFNILHKIFYIVWNFNILTFLNKNSYVSWNFNI